MLLVCSAIILVSLLHSSFVTILTSFDVDITTNLVLATSLSSIIILDIRTMRNLQILHNPVQFGPITCSCVDRNRIWLLVGTAFGTLSLWDIRFGLLLRSWTVGKGRIHQINVHPSKGKGRWVVVVEEEEDVASRADGSLVSEVWDIDRGIKVEEFKIVAVGQLKPGRRTTESTSFAMQESALDPASAIEALLSSKASPIPPNSLSPTIILSRPGVRAFLIGADYAVPSDIRSSRSMEVDGEGKGETGYLITGGEDRKLRFWDLGRGDRSTIISGLEMDEERPVYTFVSCSLLSALRLIFWQF